MSDVETPKVTVIICGDNLKTDACHHVICGETASVASDGLEYYMIGLE